MYKKFFYLTLYAKKPSNATEKYFKVKPFLREGWFCHLCWPTAPLASVVMTVLTSSSCLLWAPDSPQPLIVLLIKVSSRIIEKPMYRHMLLCVPQNCKVLS